MHDIVHRVGIAVPARQVYSALTTIDGLKHWWTTETTGDPGRNGIINFGFCEMKVVESKPATSVRWKCITGPPDWLGTEVKFKLQRKEGQTFVLFSHAHWKKQTDFMHHCSTKWGVFLLSLRDWLERNEGRPAPYDVKIHAGD